MSVGQRFCADLDTEQGIALPRENGATCNSAMCCSLPWTRLGILRWWILLAVALGGWSGACGQSGALVEVRRLEFEGGGSTRPLVTTVELRAGRNELPGARDARFVDRVKVRLILSIQRPDNQFDFYRAEVELVSMRANETVRIPFSLPGIVVERDRIRGEPFAWLVELEVGGMPLAAQPGWVSANIANNPAAVQSLKTRAENEGKVNDGILVPGYSQGLDEGNAYVRPEFTGAR